MVKWTLTPILAILLVGLSVDWPIIDTARADGSGKRVVRVGYSEFSPYSMTSSEGIAVGISVDMLRMLLERQGYVIDFVPGTNPGRMLDLLDGGEIDVTSLLGVTEARAEKGMFTNPVSDFSVAIFTDATRDPVPDKASLAGLRIGVVSGSFPAFVVADLPGTRPIDFGSYNELLAALLRGQVDAVAVSEAAMRHTAVQSNLSARLVRGPVLHSSQSAFLVAPEQVALHATLNRAIAEAQTEGSLAAIEAGWLTEAVSPALMWRRIALALIGATVLIAALLGLHHLLGLRHRARLADRYEQGFASAGQGAFLYDAQGCLTHAGPGRIRGFDGGGTGRAQTGHLSDHLRKPDAEAADVAGNGVADPDDLWLDRKATLDSGQPLDILERSADGRTCLRRTLRTPAGYVSLVFDVSALDAARDNAERQVATLRGDNDKLREFTSIAAHDLKAPLRNLRMLIDWIVEDLTESGVALPETVREKIEMTGSQLDNQHRLIGDLLAYARGGGDDEACDLDAMGRLEDIVSLAALPAGFRVEIGTDIPPLHVNPVAFDTVMRNLLSNAARHHDLEGGVIRIDAEMRDGECTICVTDDGPGVPGEVRDRIFEPFYRHNRGDGSGTGLGLALVLREVERWGGRITCRARPDGARGAQFLFTAPLARAAAKGEDGYPLRPSDLATAVSRRPNAARIVPPPAPAGRSAPPLAS